MKLYGGTSGEVEYFLHMDPVTQKESVYFLESLLTVTLIKITIGTEGRVLCCEIEQNDQKLALCNIYVPNRDEPQFFERLHKTLAEVNENKVIIGDFNVVLDVALDRYNSTNNNTSSCHRLQKLMEDYMLNEVWRSRKRGCKALFVEKV